MDSTPFRLKGLMAFKIKDLMINVLSSRLEVACDALHPVTCGQLTCGVITCGVCTALKGTIVCTPCTYCTQTCRLCTNTCGAGCTLQCSAGCTDCSGVGISAVSKGCRLEAAETAPEASLTALAALKEQLQQQLAEVEAQQAAAEANLLPQSVEEVDMLAKKLQEALDELKGHRIELAKKPKPAGD